MLVPLALGLSAFALVLLLARVNAGDSAAIDRRTPTQRPGEAEEARLADPAQGAGGRVEDHGREALPAEGVESAEEGASAPTATGAEGRLTLHVGPRPRGVDTRVGRWVRPQRFDDDDAPEWYVQTPGLAVSLSRRDGGEIPRVERFDGSGRAADEPLTLTWDGVADGVYDVSVELRGDAGSAFARLEGVRPELDERAADPRLEHWDPMLEVALMELTIRYEDAASRFVLAVSEGDEGRAIACAPRPGAEGETTLHGPYLLAHARGRPAVVYAFERTSGEVALPFRAGAVTVELPDRVPSGIAVEFVVGGADVGEDDDLSLERVAPPGEWRPPILSQWVTVHAATHPGSYVPIGVPAAGDYRWTSADGDWASETFRIEASERVVPFKVELALPR